jgi:hypothetical protein
MTSSGWPICAPAILPTMSARPPPSFEPLRVAWQSETSGAILTDDTQIRHTGEGRCLWLTWVPACAGMTRTGGCFRFQMLDLYH